VQVHARNKPIDRSGDAEHEEDALLHRVAALAVGYSGAELANLLNESAILAVRRLLCMGC
jgi:cell division protease FtsH